MDIRAFLSQNDVIVDVRFSDKVQLLKDLLSRAALVVALDQALISAEILKREELGSTGLGFGVAIPHARIPGLKTTLRFGSIEARPRFCRQRRGAGRPCLPPPSSGLLRMRTPERPCSRCSTTQKANHCGNAAEGPEWRGGLQCDPRDMNRNRCVSRRRLSD
jgi:Phosphoenolpyruvate-dependent sugar phosphotransferase system, EIIA 2